MDWLQEKCFDRQKAQQDHIEKSFNNDLNKGKSFPIGTIHNGFKKVKEGVWKKVSASHGKTKKEHEFESEKVNDELRSGKVDKKDIESGRLERIKENHDNLASKLDDKDYSDEDVHGKEQNKPLPEKGTPNWHKLQIAKDTVKNPNKTFLGGQSLEEAKGI